jgi:hypothetical protein
MDKRAVYFAIAVALTALDGFATVHYGWPAWRAWSGDTGSRGLLFLITAMGATSLVNLWTQAVPLTAKARRGHDV